FIWVWSAPVDFLSSSLSHPLSSDPVLGEQFLKPFRSQYFSRELFQRVPGVAFWVLVLVGFFSLIWNRGPNTRFLFVWVVFLAMAIYQSAAIPFFAVVAAPITAMELGQVAQRRTKTLAKLRPLFPLAGLALILLAMGITAAAWAGLVQFRESTRGWSV